MATADRASGESAAKWPQVIFLDTNALFPLGPQFENVDFTKLLELRDYLKFGVCVPSVCWMEFLRHRRREVEDHLQRISKDQAFFRKLSLHTKPLQLGEGLLRGFLERIDDHFLKAALASQLEILSPPRIELERLAKMSVERVPPFQESGEKGFRDALVMFSCLDHVRGQPELNALLITDDQKLAEGVGEHLAEFATKVDVVPSLSAGVKWMLARADEWYRAKLQEEAEEAKQLLLRYRADIEEKIREIKEFSRFEITGFKTSDIVNVDEVVSLDFKDIASAAWKEKDGKAGRLLFSAKCELAVRVSPVSWDLFNPRYAVGGGVARFASTPSVSEERRLEQTLYGEAFFVERDGELELAELRIDKMLPPEDFLTLLRQNLPAAAG